MNLRGLLAWVHEGASWHSSSEWEPVSLAHLRHTSCELAWVVIVDKWIEVALIQELGWLSLQQAAVL